MILQANEKYIDMSSVRHLLTCGEGEKNADSLTFQVDKNYHGSDLSECDFILYAANSAGNLIEQTLQKKIQDDFIFLTWTVDEYFTAAAGILELEIAGIKSDELVIKYDLSSILVRENVTGDGTPEIPNTVVIQGEKGEDGISPTITTAETEDGYDITITDATHTETITLTNGKDGADGASAYEIAVQNGFTGTEAEWLASLKGDKGDTGESGADGKDGQDGADGISPTATVTQTDTGATITITNKDGTTTAEITNGKDGNGTTITTGTFVLYASDWEDDCIKIEMDGITSKSCIDLALSYDVTSDQLEAFLLRTILPIEQGDGYFVLKAFNGAPTIDIPMRYEHRGEST